MAFNPFRQHFRFGTNQIKIGIMLHMKAICCFLVLTMALSFGGFSQSKGTGNAKKMADYIVNQVVERDMYDFGAHEFRERGSIPSIRNELYFAQSLLATGEDAWIYHARMILDKYLRLQDLDENSKTYGSWYYQDLPGNQNLEFDMFLPIPLIQIWHYQGDLLGDDLKSLMKESFGHCVKGLAKNWYPNHAIPQAIGHTNYHLMYVCDLLLLGEIVDDKNAQNLAMIAFDNWIERTLETGVTEFNSPTYLGVDIRALATIESLSTNEKAQTLARNWIDFMLSDIGIHLLEKKDKPYLTGANSRSYEILAGAGMALRAYYWCFGREIAEPSIDDILFAYIAHKPNSAILSLHTLTKEDGFLFKSMWGLDLWETRQTWFGKDFIIGTSGKSYGSQDRTVVFDRRDDKWPFSMTQVIQINDRPDELPQMGGGSGRNHPRLPIFVNHEENRLIEVIDISPSKNELMSAQKISLTFVLPQKFSVIAPRDAAFPVRMNFDTPFGIIVDNDMIFVRAKLVGLEPPSRHFRQFGISGIAALEKNIVSEADAKDFKRAYVALCVEVAHDVGNDIRTVFDELCKAPFEAELKNTILTASFKNLRLDYETINRRPMSVPSVLVTETAQSPWTCLNRKTGVFYAQDEKINLRIP